MSDFLAPDIMALLTDPQTYLSLVSLALLEIVLGIDNIIFISILAGKLPAEQRNGVRRTGLMIALVGRLLLLSGIAWLVNLTTPFLNIGPVHMSGKDIVLLLGGLFLIWKSASEIYEKVEAHDALETTVPSVNTISAVLAQIVMIDIVFSLDSIITAVGLVKEIAVMMAAVVISMLVMLWASAGIGAFIDRHPSVKILALSFLLMIGTMLTAEAFHYEIPKGYIYFSLAFSLAVEALNIRYKRNSSK